MSKIHPTQQSGFTLVELLIVVIILAILAAIVVPQFSASTDDAKAAALESNTNAFRQAINFYYQQHGEYPGANAGNSPATCQGATLTGAAAESATAVINQLTLYTNEDGEACQRREGTGTPAPILFPYGPYLREIPENPNNGQNTIATPSTTGDLVLAPSASATDGWNIDVKSGVVVANTAP